MNIPTGWQIQITTWENDADDYQTQTISGLPKEEDVYFYIDLASQFKSNGRADGQCNYGNNSQYASTIVGIVLEMLEKHPNISEQVRNLWEAEFEGMDMTVDIDEDDYNAGDRLYELLVDNILGYPVNDYYADQERFCRVFDKFRVFYFAEPMHEVTHLFKE